MRISDWSSDVCSSDLPAPTRPAIDGSSAAAILLMLLDEEEAATILKHLGPDEVKGLAKAMYDTANATERSEEHTSELQSLMRISYAVFCLKKKKNYSQYCSTHLHISIPPLNDHTNKQQQITNS